MMNRPLQQTGTDPEHAVMVGDTVWDVEAARKAGVQFIAVLTGGISRQALEEAGAAAIYDESGNILTASLADYLPPTAREIPDIEIHHLATPTQASVTKAKGLGEGGAIGAPAAVLNAINDALSPFGVSIDELPATPQRIRAALRTAGARSKSCGPNTAGFGPE